jgi:hypothetical protein
MPLETRLSQMDLNLLQSYIAWQYGSLGPKHVHYNDNGDVTAICNEKANRNGRIFLCKTSTALQAAYYAKEKGKL